MADEKVFLNENSVFVSNCRVVMSGVIYSVSNITSIRKITKPSSQLFAILTMLFGFLGILVSWFSFSEGTGPRAIGLLLSLAVAGGGFLWLRSLKPSHHAFMTSASGETQTLSSKDETLVDKVIRAVSEAIVHRG